jgi:hypothetical protein
MNAAAVDDRVEVARGAFESHQVDRAPLAASRSQRTSPGGTCTVGG